MTSPVTTTQSTYYKPAASNTPPVPFSSYGASSNKTSSGIMKQSQQQHNMMLAPSLRVKTNELFYKWLSSRERAEQLREAINIIKNTNRVPRITDLESFKIDEKTFSGGHYGHQPLTSSSSSSSNHQQYYYNNNDNLSSSSLGKQSGRPSSPPMSPIPAHLRMPMSPKSPRNRPNSTFSKAYADLIQQQNKQQPPQSSNSILVQLTDQTKQQSPRDFDNKSGNQGMKITASSSVNNSMTANKQPQSKPSNEKEIQIQRVSSSSSQQQQPGSPLTNDKKNEISTSPKVNYVDVQVVKSDLNGKTNGAPNTTTTSTATANKTPNPTFTPVITVQQQVQHLQPVTVTKQVLKQQPKVTIPSFHFPHGRPDSRQFKSSDDVECMKAIGAKFKSLGKDGKLNKDEFGEVVKLLDLPYYWKILIFRACTQNAKLNYITYSAFEQGWPKITNACFDKVSLFMKLISSSPAISPSSAYIVYEDWEPLLQDIVDTHPGLKFLHDHKEFHSRYIKTVIARIYYTVNRSWSGRITLAELKRSNFLQVLESIEHEDDINSIKDFFSYEHFYVIYCKFWELDKDHDLFISREDLYRHNNYSISVKVIDRIFSGTVFKSKETPSTNNRDSTGSGNNLSKDGLMSYYDFVWFLISEEDKRNPTSIEYWFRVLDLDGDGVLSMYELEYFYNEQIDQMRERQIEFMPFNDLLCQILDLVKPQEPGKIRLKDLKNCKMTNVFFDTFINLEKYLEYEQRDPFSNIRDLDSPEQSDWDKYAAEEYENLVSEDYNADNQDPYNNYDDDFEDDPLLFNSPTSTGANNLSNTNGMG